MTLRILQIDVPAPQLASATSFWADALSATPADAPGVFVHLVGATSALEVHVHPLGDDPARYHLDVEADDRDAEVARLTGFGAREVARFAEGYTVLADPAGNLLCVIEPDAAVPTPVAPRSGARGYLDAVVMDVPADRVADQVRFWSATLAVGELAEVVGPGGPVEVAIQAMPATSGTPGAGAAGAASATARLRVRLSSTDVAAETARLIDLGATPVAAMDGAITLADPCGNLLSVVPTSGT